MHIQLTQAILVVTKGGFNASVRQVQVVPERRFHGNVQTANKALICDCSWSDTGRCLLNEPQFDIDMQAPIGYVLRWHLNNAR